MTKEKFYAIVSSVYVGYLVWSFSSAVFPPILNMMLPIGVLVISILLYPKIVLSNKSFIWGCIYVFASILVLGFHPLSGYGFAHGGFDTLTIESAWLLPSIAVGAVLVNDRRHFLKPIFLTVLIALSLSLIYIAPISFANTSAIRLISATRMFGNEVDGDLAQYVTGFWNYTMFHVIALSLAVIWGLAFHCKEKRVKIAAIFLVATIAIVVVQSCISTTQIYLVAVVILLFWNQWKKARAAITVAIIIALIFLITNISDVLYFLLDYYQGTATELKIRDFIDLLEGGSGTHATIDGRLDYQQDAINAFYRNIIIGDTYSGGGHSIFLNRLGSLGLLGFIPFVLTIYYQFRQWYQRIPTSSHFYYLLSWAGAILLMYSKNCFNQEGYLFISVVIPVICMMYRESSNTEHSLK